MMTNSTRTTRIAQIDPEEQMKAGLADWYRAAELIPNHDDMVNRRAAIEAFTGSCTSERIIELGHCFFGLSTDNPSVSDMRQAAYDADNSFSAQNNTVELRVLAGACLMELLDGSEGILAALALVCPSVLGTRDALLVPDICLRATKFLDTESLQLRLPQSLVTKRVSATQIDEDLASLTEAANANTFNTAGPHIVSALKALHSTLSGLVRKCNRLERNQQLFREDSDILWWMTGGFSRDLQQPLAGIEPMGVPAILGKELADLTYVRPGPFAAAAVLDRCLRQCGVPDKSLSLSQIVNRTPLDWRRLLLESIGDCRDVLRLCPVSCAISTSVEIPGERKWQAPFEATTSIKPSCKLEPRDWAFQMYRECLFIRTMSESQ